MVGAAEMTPRRGAHIIRREVYKYLYTCQRLCRGTGSRFTGRPGTVPFLRDTRSRSRRDTRRMDWSSGIPLGWYPTAARRFPSHPGCFPTHQQCTDGHSCLIIRPEVPSHAFYQGESATLTIRQRQGNRHGDRLITAVAGEHRLMQMQRSDQV